MFAVRAAFVLGFCVVFPFASEAIAQDARLIGTWQADPEKSAAAVEDAQLAEQIRALAKAGVNLRIVVTKDQMTAHLEQPGGEGQKRTGKWKLIRSRTADAILKVTDDQSGKTHQVKIVFLEKNVVRVEKDGVPWRLVFSK